MSEQRVPFNRAYTTGFEIGYMSEAIRETRLSGNGPFSDRCAQWLMEHTAAARAFMTHSATGALEMATLLAGISLGDEVIMPSFTFTSTANAVVLRGATPVFVDIRPDTLNLDENLVGDAVTRRTRAIMPVHYAGVPCAMDEILDLARIHGLAVIEDAAQALGSTYRGRPAGGLGDFGAISFHETKNVMCGEGGALLVNNAGHVDAAEIALEKGTDRRRFFRGEVDKYTWIDVGSSFVLSELNAAFLWAQLEHVDEIQRLRRTAWDLYHEALAPLEESELLRRPVVPPDCEHNAHLYYVLLSEDIDRPAFLTTLASREVDAVFHYVPLHSSPAGSRYGRAEGVLPVTDSSARRLVRLPLWAGLNEGHVDRVVEVVSAALGLAGRPRRVPLL
jgi:dTDP-4-amino-4,6-dideoxygalactose transaminase